MVPRTRVAAQVWLRPREYSHSRSWRAQLANPARVRYSYSDMRTIILYENISRAWFLISIICTRSRMLNYYQLLRPTTYDRLTSRDTGIEGLR